LHPYQLIPTSGKIDGMNRILPALVLFFASLGAGAQTPYRITQESPVIIAGEEFIQYELRSEDAIDCDSPGQLRPHQALLAANLAGSLLAGYGVYKLENDKQRHVLAGYVIGNVTTGTLQLILPKDMKHRKAWAIAGGIGAAVLVGVAKEFRDSKGYGHVETMDAVVTGLGGVGGSLTIGFGDISKAFKRK
jgi:hypothetical protein